MRRYNLLCCGVVEIKGIELQSENCPYFPPFPFSMVLYIYLITIKEFLSIHRKFSKIFYPGKSKPPRLAQLVKALCVSCYLRAFLCKPLCGTCKKDQAGIKVQDY